MRSARADALEPRVLLAATITVNSTADANARDADLTLREAILVSNRTLAVAALSAQEQSQIAGSPTAGDADTIAFAIPATDAGHFFYANDGVANQVSLAAVTATTASNDAGLANADPDWPHAWFSIAPTDSLPTIIDPLTIDGTTQGESTVNTNPAGQALNSVLRIEINAQNAGQLTTGLLYSQGVGSGGNVIRGLVLNRVQGPKILLEDDTGSNVVAGNYIGPDVSGSLAFPEPSGSAPIGLDGVRTRTITSDNNLIGDSFPAARNLISGNAGFTASGVHLAASSGNLVLGNLIGTDRSGTRALGNGNAGVTLISTNNTVGGDFAAAINVISANSIGIDLRGAGSLVRGNRIGAGVTGGSLGNTAAGITFNGSATNTQVIQNVITANGTAGSGDSSGIVFAAIVGTGNLISENSIFANTGPGIDINNDGVTANDPPDTDSGPNAVQNSPVITSVTATGGGGTHVEGTLSTVANATVRIEFFASSNRDEDSLSVLGTLLPGQIGEGETFVGSQDVTTDGSGDATFSVDLAPLPAGQPFVTATATDVTNPGGGARNNTSEFSNVVPLGGPSTVVTSTADTGLGTLREAIHVANTTADAQTITFAIPATDARHFYYQNNGVAGTVSRAMISTTTSSDDSAISDIDPDWAHSWFSLDLTRVLPSVLGPTTIDGYTQSGSAANTLPALGPLDTVLRIELDGTGITGPGVRVALGIGPNAIGGIDGGSGSTVRGLAINRFSSHGVHLGSFGNTTIAGNFIGTDVSGTVGLGNGGTGVLVEIESNSVVGGTDPAGRNLISASGMAGVELLGGLGQRVLGNLIGPDRTMQFALPNIRGAGIVRPDNTVSVTAALAAARSTAQPPASANALADRSLPAFDENVAAGLRDAFVVFKVLGEDTKPDDVNHGENTTWTLNGAPAGNPGPSSLRSAPLDTEALVLGFDLKGDGITANDPGDTDTGPNGLQNFPVLTSATTEGASTTIAGTLDSLPGESYLINFYSQSVGTNFRAGEVFLGSTTITTDNAGDATFSFAPDQPVAGGQFITATAALITDGSPPNGLTSEFGDPLQVNGDGTPPPGDAPTVSIDDVQVAEGPRGRTTATFTVSLSAAPTMKVTVKAGTEDGSARVIDKDFARKRAARLSFTPTGPLTKTVVINITGDTVVEPDETFLLTLSEPVGATILDGTGVGTITNDDTPGLSAMAAVATDPLSSAAALFITGTSGNDALKLKLLPDGLTQIRSGRDVLGSFDLSDPTRRIYFDAGDGNDKIDLSKLANPGFIELGAGNDQAKGGPAADLLLGGLGRDKLTGNAGRDVIAGGDDADTVSGETRPNQGDGENLITGNRFAFDADDDSLNAVLTAWSGAGDFATRVAQLRVGSPPIDATTILNDVAVDRIFGGAASDWLLDLESDEALADRVAAQPNDQVD